MNWASSGSSTTTTIQLALKVQDFKTTCPKTPFFSKTFSSATKSCASLHVRPENADFSSSNSGQALLLSGRRHDCAEMSVLLLFELCCIVCGDEDAIESYQAEDLVDRFVSSDKTTRCLQSHVRQVFAIVTTRHLLDRGALISPLRIHHNLLYLLFL